MPYRYHPDPFARDRAGVDARRRTVSNGFEKG
jgi:hypothetical protein